MFSKALLDRQVDYNNFSAELKAQVREIEANLEKIAMPLSNQKAMVEKVKGKSGGETYFSPLIGLSIELISLQ